MTTFLRLLADKEKASNLLDSCSALRADKDDTRVIQIEPESFRSVPGAPFAYWVSEAVRQVFANFSSLEGNGRVAQHGGSTKDDFRFLRIWWEGTADSLQWTLFAKGGAFSRFYADVYLTVNWKDDAYELEAALLHKYPYLGDTANWVLHRECNYLRPGLTWPRRTTSGLSLRAMPQGCIFADKGPAAFIDDDTPENLLALLALLNSQAFGLLVSLQLAAADAAARSYEVGVIQRTPIPDLSSEQQSTLAGLARRAWSLKRTLDTIEEISHSFILPASIRQRLGNYDPPSIYAELARIQAEIDVIAFDLYGFSDADRDAVQATQDAGKEGDAEALDNNAEDDSEDEKEVIPIDNTAGLLSWAAGVVFGRFDWRLATGEWDAPTEPEPFDPLPAKSPGMLPDGAAPFHAHAGILVDEEGHPHDLARLVEEVLKAVDAPIPADVRRWLQREFFPFHLKRYSKSRRKAPIYWPLSTLSGSYTLWLYYPSLTSQTLFTVVNDFVEPKLKQVRDGLEALRNKGANRSKQEEKQLESATDLAQELADLRDTLLSIAPKYFPNHDDGVQIAAAPLWPLFNHKPWQRVLKDTWQKLEQGDYDWAHMAMNYWPERVLRKCHQDRSLAIAHEVEELFWHEVEVPVKRGKKMTGETKLEWQPKDLSEAELSALIQARIKEINA